jgi:transposase-like protein
MGSRHPNPRLAKIHRSYSVEEVARLFNVHKNTVRSWLKLGLEAIDGQRPTVVRGESSPSAVDARSGHAAPAASTACRAERQKFPPGGWPNAW